MSSFKKKQGYKKSNRLSAPRKEPIYKKIPLVGSTHYLSLSNNDLIYFGNLHQFNVEIFRVTIEKMTLDLNLLLSYGYDDFWKELSSSSSLRLSLQSCLANFPKKIYGKTKKRTQSQNQELFRNKLFELWSILIKIVLLTYHRIACESKPEEKQIIYDEWLFDIPKIIYLIGIYGDSNSKLVKEILANIFQSIKTYREDFKDFLFIVESVILNSIETDLQFQYHPTLLKKSSNFSNPLISFTCNLVKSLFTTLDSYNSFLQVYEYFPINLVYQLVISNSIQVKLMKFYHQYMENVEKRWVLAANVEKLITPTYQLLREKMIEYFLKTFQLMYSLLQDQDHIYWSKCLKTYVSLCKLMLDSQSKHIKQLPYILIREIKVRSLFVLTKEMEKELNRENIRLLERGIALEVKFNQQLKKQQGFFSFAEVAFVQMPTFKDWTYSCEELFKFHDAVDEVNFLNFDEQFQLEEQLSGNTQEKIQEKQKKPKKYIFNEYDDEPEYEEEEAIREAMVLPFEQTYDKIEDTEKEYIDISVQNRYQNYEERSNLSIAELKHLPQKFNKLPKIQETFHENQEESIEAEDNQNILQSISFKEDEANLSIEQLKEGQETENDLSFSENKGQNPSKLNLSDQSVQIERMNQSLYSNMSDITINQKPKKKKKYKMKK